MRLIDADALSEKLCETTIFIKDGEVFQRLIHDAPTVSAEAVHRWIPVSERLPSESGWYLITVQGCEKVADMGWYYGERDVWEGVSSEQQVIAWMPLPEPYKGGEEE